MATGEIKIKVREEGTFVNAYIEIQTAPPETIHIAAVRKTLLDAHPHLFDAFNGFNVAVVSAIIESIGGEVNKVTVEQAPEHERAGHA